ncbi:hypothetical protein ACJJIP_16515 [Microbulbifer sp. VTAC004]|uniref:hypothetical protein n=1 Tax=Microbulbifer sp. VTAC004 TaxID=3243386 RepID=UPI004039CD56
MSHIHINHRVLLKSVLISAIVSTVVMAFFSGYGKTITPDGVVTHYYNFSSVFLWMPILFMVMMPTIVIVAYLLGIVLIKSRLFSLPIVVIAGAAGGGLVISMLSGKWLMFSIVGLYYIVSGIVSAVTCYYLYKKFNKALNSQASPAGTPKNGAH